MNLMPLIGPASVTIAGLILLWWGLACRAGRFGRNPILGYRTPAALRSAPAWNAAHRGYAPWILLAGAVLIAAGIATAIGMGTGAGVAAAPLLGGGVIIALAAMITGGFAAHRALAAHLRENGEHADGRTRAGDDITEDGGP